MVRTVLILGASSDIGLSVIDYYLKNNWKIVAHGNLSVKRLSGISDLVTPFQLDMSDLKVVATFIQSNHSLFNNVSVIINCLGFIEPKEYFDIDHKHIIKTFNVNLFSPTLFNTKLIKQMVSQGWGRVVNLSSIGVKFGGGVNTTCYSMTKHALEFMPADHKKWASHDVLYNTIRVGVTNTKIHKIDNRLR